MNTNDLTQKFSAQWGQITRFATQRRFEWDESAHPREATEHDGKRPGQFAPKQSPPLAEKAAPSSADRTQFEKFELVLSNQRIAHFWARKFAKQPSDLDDLLQEANLGLMRAAQDWDSSKSQFTSYATFWIRSYVRRAALKLQRERGIGGDDQQPIETLVHHSKETDENQIKKRLQVLDANHRAIIERSFGIGREQESDSQIADDLGVSRQHVNAMKLRALQRMRFSVQDILRFAVHFFGADPGIAVTRFSASSEGENNAEKQF